MRKNRDSGKKFRMFMVIFVAFIMFGSIFSIIFFGFSGGTTSQSNKITYNGFDLTFANNQWSTTVNDIPAAFIFPPNDLELLIVDNNAITLLKNQAQVDITSDFNDIFAEPIAIAEFQMEIILNQFSVFSRFGFINATENNFPVITCSKATQFVPVIYFKSGNFTQISLEGSCVIAEFASPNDAIRVKDRLLYGMLGIIN